MEITAIQIGQMIESLSKNNYFHSNSLADAIATMKNDQNTSFSLLFQFENLTLQEQTLVNELVAKAKMIDLSLQFILSDIFL